MPVQTERVTFLAPKGYKKWLNGEAKKEGLSVSALIRQRLENNQGMSEEALVRAIVKEVKRTARKADKSVAKEIKNTQQALREIKEMKKRR